MRAGWILIEQNYLLWPLPNSFLKFYLSIIICSTASSSGVKEEEVEEAAAEKPKKKKSRWTEDPIIPVKPWQVHGVNFSSCSTAYSNFRSGNIVRPSTQGTDSITTLKLRKSTQMGKFQ